MIKIKNYKEHLLVRLQNADEAAAYLNAAMHDGDPQVFLLALRDIAEAQGGMSWLAAQTDLNREHLYRTLSLKGNPRLFNLLAVLNAIGLEMSINPQVKKRAKRTLADISHKKSVVESKKIH